MFCSYVNAHRTTYLFQPKCAISIMCMCMFWTFFISKKCPFKRTAQIVWFPDLSAFTVLCISGNVIIKRKCELCINKYTTTTNIYWNLISLKNLFFLFYIVLRLIIEKTSGFYFPRVSVRIIQWSALIYNKEN